LLDAEPLPGSKRIPIIEIEDNGTAAFNLWYSTVEGAASGADDKISIVPTKALCARGSFPRRRALCRALASHRMGPQR
jgi:hypothetical protein